MSDHLSIIYDKIDSLISLVEAQERKEKRAILESIIFKCENVLQADGVQITPRVQPLNEKKKIRAYLDGCFDIMHSGHYNAIRQAKKIADILVVGIHSDKEIEKFKGPTTMKEDERYNLLRACKWVDEVVEDVPYVTTMDLLDKLNCDVNIHGDDIPRKEDGTSIFDEVEKAGRMKIIKRTEGISTTDIVGRMLLMTRTHHLPSDSVHHNQTVSDDDLYPVRPTLLPTVHRLLEFSNDISRIMPTDKVVYIDGDFDLFHVGHVEILQKLKEFGNFVLVGVHDDSTVNKHWGRNYPIMNMYERVLNVLSCKYVDEVIMGPPWVPTHDMITTMNIHLVIGCKAFNLKSVNGEDRFAYVKKSGKYKEIESARDLSVDEIVKRIIQNREQFEQKFSKGDKKQQLYNNSKKFNPEL
eukprot:TRINITY_DN13023_c0_g1_i1.p1 TRINITY_DN13023_c0_g1~~TRINITY_DN13023_c0_g1_i1.p1  ORF type:complete len:421 (-),score=91.69 TRINITY_DN13023_c0_g1_i1:145-1377(-)